MPEDFAGELLEQERLQRSDIQTLFDMLPKEHPPRQEEGQTGGTSFTTGCYSKGGITGLRHNTTAYPKSTRVLVRFARQTFPSLRFTTLALFDGVKTPMHRDSRNGPHPNGVCPVSTFTGGQIWVEEDGGGCVMDTPKGKSDGKLLEVAEGPVVLEAQTCYHCTLPWEGRRLVLVAYVVAGLERLAAEHHALVEGIGFQLPPKFRRFTLRRRPNSQASPLGPSFAGIGVLRCWWSGSTGRLRLRTASGYALPPGGRLATGGTPSDGRRRHSLVGCTKLL